MSTVVDDALAGTPVRQSDDVIERLDLARHEARAAVDVAQHAYDRAAHLLAGSVRDGYDVPEDWREQYRSAERALDSARATWDAARVEWYHARGKHAHRDLTLCCQPDHVTSPGRPAS